MHICLDFEIPPDGGIASTATAGYSVYVDREGV
jgi:hypothetical protein